MLRRMSMVIDVDLSKCFDTIVHSVLLDKIATRIQDLQVLHLIKQILKVAGKVGVPQGGPFSPLAANIYLNEVDWTFDAIRHAGATPIGRVIAKLNAALAGWVNYFRVGNSSRAFSEVRDYLEMKVRTLLTRRKRRRKTSVGGRRWSTAYLYEALKLYWDWKIHPLPGVEQGA